MGNRLKTGPFGNRGRFPLTQGMARPGVKRFGRTPLYLPSISRPSAPILLLAAAFIAYAIFNLCILFITHIIGLIFVLFLGGCLIVWVSRLSPSNRAGGTRYHAPYRPARGSARGQRPSGRSRFR